MVRPSTLLVDNYDSYTFNLFQLLSTVYGSRPQVVRNDDPRLRDLAARSDLAVISPGPGHPRNEADAGLSAVLLGESGPPVLGVCLGHQCIAARAGASIGRALRARHGHVSRIRHVPDPLFAGIPQSFAAVRYHSLSVQEPLPPELIPLAWAEDDVLMALRHRDRPWWGVQFHPESVLTEYGAALLANFRDAALPRCRQGSGAGPRKYQAHVAVIESEPDPEEVFACLFQPHDYAAWLDSPPGSSGRGRFSYLLLASGALGEVLSCRLDEGITRLQKVGGGFRAVPGPAFDVLGRELAMRTIQAPELPFDFTGGFVGYFGYELKADCGGRRAHRAASPDALWLFPDRFAVVDHLSARAYLVALSDESPGTRQAALSWLDEAGRAIRGMGPRGPGQAMPDIHDDEARRLAEAWLVRDGRTYRADVRGAQRKLLEGESYEICLTNAVRLPRTAEPWPYYRFLRRYNPAPYAAYIGTPGISVASSSPERFLKISRDRVVESKPIKGTAARGRDRQEDARLRGELLASAKNRAENLMIVDLLRSDLGRVCVPGTVQVPVLMQVESHQTVHQLVSTVRGVLEPGAGPVDCVRACFPGGSMTGAPRLRTMTIIDELETEARGVYSGCIGFLGCNGTADLGIAIRTAVFLPDAIRIGAGGAVVLDSDPEEEYQEMLLKAVAPLRALLACQQSVDARNDARVTPVTS